MVGRRGEVTVVPVRVLSAGGSTSDQRTWIWSTVPTAPLYRALRGASMASPFVAGAAALVKAKCPTYTPAQVETRLVSSALDLGVAGVDPTFGAGRLQVDQALAPGC